MSRRWSRPAASTGRRLSAAGLIGTIVLLGACGGGATGDAVGRNDSAESATVGTPSSSQTGPTDSKSGAKDDASPSAEVTADDIAVAFTPAGGWTKMPPPVLAACTEPLVAGAVDMRGLWEVASVQAGGVDAPDHRAIGERQRIEQCGDRVVITAGGIIHDMRADGTEAGAVHDVAGSDKTTPITAVASFEGAVHVLRPIGTPIEVKRWIEGDQLVWEYVGFTARFDRVDVPQAK